MFFNSYILTFITDRPVIDSPSVFRGFIAGKFPFDPFFHNHSDSGALIYGYPKVQYKIINKMPMILGICEGSGAVEGISNIEELNLKDKIYLIINKKSSKETVSFGVVDRMLSYKFLTPWLALDEESFGRYKNRNQEEKKKQLESILVGNIISMSKGLEYIITDMISATLNVREIKIPLKGVRMIGFLGNFSVNFEIPDYFGLGKSVSRGFGTVKRIEG